MNILFLTTLFPYPLNEGGKIKTYNTLSVLSKKNKVDLISFSEKAVNKAEYNQIKKLCNNIDVYIRKITASEHKVDAALKVMRDIFNYNPYVVNKYRDKRVVNCIKERMDTIKYDLIYIDHLQMSIYYDCFNGFSGKILLDEHNCESVIMKRRCEQSNNVLFQQYWKYEYQKLKRYENNMLKNVDRIVTLSDEDGKELNKLCDVDISKKLFKIPIMVQKCKQKDITKYVPQEGIKILFLGTLTWEPNNQGMIWFLQNVVPLLNMDNIELYIIGKNPSEVLKKLAQEYKQIHVLGFVEDVDEYFDLCDFMIVPLFIGSGQRVKIIEAFSRGFPVISTSIGAEGLEYKNNESILIADNQDEFVSKIQEMKNIDLYKKVSRESNKIYEYNYSYDALSKRIEDSIYVTE